MNRSKLRENIFKLLYTAEFQEKEEMPQQMSLYFTYSDDNDEDEEVTVSEKDQTYMEEKYHHVTEHIPEIDEMLNRTSEGWKTTRMGKVDLAILRLAVYEMKFDEDVPVGVAINEAVVWQSSPPDSDSLRSNLYLVRQAVDKPFDQALIRTHPGLGWSISAR